MKTSDEVFKKMADYIEKAVNESYEVKEQEYLDIAKELGWVIGITPECIDEGYERMLEAKYDS